MSRGRAAIAQELTEARKRIDAWRRRRTTRAMPAALWDLATQLGLRHGVSPTARALGVRPDRLRARVAELRSRTPSGPASFVEVRPAAGMPACRVEWEDGRGGRMRVDLASDASPALEVLGRLFLGQGA